jgi:hypothetical protein
VIDTSTHIIVPSEEILLAVMEELSDMDRIPFGRVKIAAAAAGVYNILEPGADDEDPVKEFEAVILMSHSCNAYWPDAFGSTDNKNPACASMDGKEGMTQDGEVISCATCPYNQFGSSKAGDGKGKACKNMRRLYLLREGDVLPLVLSLPPSALAAYDKYRTRLSTAGKKSLAVMTKFTLVKSKNAQGTAYSVPQFEAVSVLPLAEVERVREYAAAMLKSAQNVGITADDYSAAAPEDAGRVQTGTNSRMQNAKDAAISVDAQSGFTQVDADELPDNF